MSTTQIYNTATIKNKANEIITQNGELKKIIAEMESIVSEMTGVWKDSAQTKFVQQFNQMKPELESFCKSIADFAQRAEDHANEVEKGQDVL